MATRISLFDFKKSIVEIHLTIDEQRNFDSCEDEPDASAPLTSDEIAKYGLSEGKNIWKHLGKNHLRCMRIGEDILIC
jgi:hypothetical protein